MTQKSRTTLRAGVLFTLLIMALPSAAELAAGSMDVKWNEGAEDCSKTAQPPLQVHRFNEVTFILRENPCATYEAPFMYLCSFREISCFPGGS